MSLILFSNIITTSFLVGLIWFVQVVHYPTFKEVGKQNFYQFHTAHTYLTGRVVILPMLSELVLSFWLVWEKYSLYSILALFLTALLWLLTAWIFVPLHEKLGNEHKGYNLEIMKKLVTRNWWRTVFWSLRLLLLIYMTFQVNEI